MTYTFLVGAALLGLAPVIAVFALMAARRPQSMILSIGASFFFLLAISCASIVNTFAFLFLSEEYKQYVWAFVLPISVVLQELIRVFFMVMYGKMRQASIMEGASEEDRDRLTDTQHPSKLSDIIGIGLGFAAGSSMLMFFPVLWEARGSGLLFSQACPNVPIYLVSAATTFAFSVMHFMWTYIIDYGLATRQYYAIGFVMLSHIMASLVSAMQTILNSVSGEYLCVVSVLGVFAISIVVAFVVWRIARRDDVTS